MIEWIVVLSLATYRCTRFIIQDSLIDAPRAWVKRSIMGIKTGAPPPRVAAWRRKLLELLDCPYCISVWVALGLVMSARLAGSGVPLPFWVWLGTAGGTMAVWRFCED